MHGYVLPRDALDDLLAAIGRRFRLIGPVVRDGVIVYEEIGSAADLPVGWTDVQDATQYRLERRDDQAVFGYALFAYSGGPQGWKRYLFPPSELLGAAPQQAPDPARPSPVPAQSAPEPAQPLAFIGVRACELHAISIQDRIFLGGFRGGRPPEPAEHRRQPPRPVVRGASFRRVHRGGELRPVRRDVFLRLDGSRAEGVVRLRPGAHRTARRAAPVPCGRRQPPRGRSYR